MMSPSSTTVTKLLSLAGRSVSRKIQTTPRYQFNVVNGERWYSSYEYPNRTEAPTVTRTLASSAAVEEEYHDNEEDNNKSSSFLHSKNQGDESKMSSIRDRSRIKIGEVDHFDDGASLTQEEKQMLLSKQATDLNTKVKSKHRIEINPPSSIPPNTPPSALQVPMTKVTRLQNGIRVASQETYGQVSTVGVLVDSGSRYESSSEGTEGVNHLMELLSFQSTLDGMSGSDIVAKMDEIGGATFASCGREQFMWCVDVMRPNVSEAMRVLAGSVLRPAVTDEEVEEMKRVIEFQHVDLVPEVKLGEGLQMAAYGPLSAEEGQQQLGKPHFCPLDALPHLTSASVRAFRESNVLRPSDMVISGSGIGHEELVELAQEYFSQLSSVADDDDNKTRMVPSRYTGGEFRLPTESSVDGFTRLALAFEVDGWHSDDLVPTCVLQTLLGGGNSFSAGGPGKGMYSRLYREVLNRYYWAESAEAFTSFHVESGLLGMTGSSVPGKSRDMMRILSEHFWKLSSDFVTDEELDRARNMLKCNVLTQLESRLVLFEDIGRQILTYGKREDVESICHKIDNVQKEHIKEVASRALLKPPTVGTVGDDLSGVPSQEEVASWFRQ